MYKNILVPIALDSEHAPDVSLRTARLLAAPDARITLLNVIDELPGFASTYLPEGYGSDMRRKTQAEIDALAANFDDAVGVVREGKPATEILNWADKHACDCIVVASHRPGLGDYLIGSTAARVVRHAKCAVMVLR